MDLAARSGLESLNEDDKKDRPAVRDLIRLRTLGVRCARKRVARLMREASLFGCGGRRKKARTTLRSQTDRTPPAPDLVKRDFTPEAPDRLWVADTAGSLM
jgi:putative transposase